MTSLVALLLLAPPCPEHVCKSQGGVWTTMEFWRADQRDRARVDEQLSVCGADLDFCRASAGATETLLRRKNEACSEALRETKGLAMDSESRWAGKVAQAEAERDSRLSTAEVVWVGVGSAVGGALILGLIMGFAQ